MCAGSTRASWQGARCAPRCIPQLGAALGIEPHPRQANVRRLIAHKEAAFLPLPVDPPRPTLRRLDRAQKEAGLRAPSFPRPISPGQRPPLDQREGGASKLLPSIPPWPTCSPLDYDKGVCRL